MPRNGSFAVFCYRAPVRRPDGFLERMMGRSNSHKRLRLGPNPHLGGAGHGCARVVGHGKGNRHADRENTDPRILMRAADDEGAVPTSNGPAAGLSVAPFDSRDKTSRAGRGIQVREGRDSSAENRSFGWSQDQRLGRQYIGRFRRLALTIELATELPALETAMTR